MHSQPMACSTSLPGTRRADDLKSAPVSLNEHALAALSAIEAAGQLRRPRAVDGPQQARLTVDGRSVLSLCSNDYLGLANHPALLAAAQRALRAQGMGAGAARHISGNMAAHRELEVELAEFTGHSSALLFSSGYGANVGVLSALAGRGDVIFSDALNHASLVDGARLSRARVVIYRHADAGDLERKLTEHRHEGRLALIASESLFSMDGDQAPLSALTALARRFDAALILDEAHALGVMGPSGTGLARASGVRPDVTVGTLGKAFGSQGAFAAGSSPVVDLLRNQARSFVFSTAPAPVLAAASLAALRLIREGDDSRSRLRGHWRELRDGLAALGYQVLPGDSAIIPVLVGPSERTMALSQRLFDLGVFVHGIRPPTVPAGQARLRVVPSAAHSEEDIAEALRAFAEARR
jgi:glycine C-acetyltransferase